MTALKTRKPTGRPSWPLILLAGEAVCRCGHTLEDHDADAWDASGDPVNRRCRVVPCDCGWDKTS